MDKRGSAILCNMSIKELLQKAMENNLTTTELVCKSSLDEDDKQNKIEKLRTSMKTYCQVDYNFKKYEQYETRLLSSEYRDMLERRSSEDRNLENVHEVLETISREKDDVTQHEFYQKLDESIRRIQSEVVDGMEVIESAPNIICPVSKKIMSEPMTNKLCGHIYDKSSIYELLKLQKKGIRCPVPGCAMAFKKSLFTANDLELNKKLQNYISQSQKSQTN